MSQYVITISRQFGSGGRHIGHTLSEELGISCYDKAIIQMAAEKSGLSAGYIEKTEESIPSTFLFNLKYTAYSAFDSMNYYEVPMTDKMFQAQTDVITEIAGHESCIIVGRCADYILRDKPNLFKIFIMADMPERIKRAVESHNLTGDKIEERIRKIDKSRSNYYKYYTGRNWADMSNYDLIINSSCAGEYGAVALIKTLLHSKGQI